MLATISHLVSSFGALSLLTSTLSVFCSKGQANTSGGMDCSQERRLVSLSPISCCCCCWSNSSSSNMLSQPSGRRREENSRPPDDDSLLTPPPFPVARRWQNSTHDSYRRPLIRSCRSLDIWAVCSTICKKM